MGKWFRGVSVGVLSLLIAAAIWLPTVHLFFRGDFAVKPNRGLFVDGEIALIMAMRRMVEEKPEYAAPMRERIEVMLSRMEQSPVLSAESYPSECWIFCNTVALAAIMMGDVLDGTDHSEFLGRWVRTAKLKVAENLLNSSAFHPAR